MTTTVTEANKVTIPADLATDLGIKPGTQLDWQTTDKPGTLLVKVLPSRAELIARVFGAGQKYLKPGDDPIRDLIEERVREDAEREGSL